MTSVRIRKNDQQLLVDKETGEVIDAGTADLVVLAEQTGVARLDHNGHEVCSPVPMEPPIGYVPEVSIFDHIGRLVQRHNEGWVEGEEGDDEPEFMSEDEERASVHEERVQQARDYVQELQQKEREKLTLEKKPPAEPAGSADQADDQGARGAAPAQKKKEKSTPPSVAPSKEPQDD